MKTGDFRFHNIEKKELAHIDVCVDGEVIRFIPESLLEKERERVYEEVIEIIDKRGGVYDGSDWMMNVLNNHLKSFKK